jgi:hypothetical protein
MFSNKVLKRFVKDYKLPIQVIQQPYFEYFLDLYNADYNAKEKYKLLEQAISKFDSEDIFLAEYYNIRDKVINSIKETEAFQDFNNMKLDDFNVPNKGYPAHDIFNLGNIDKYFISIDLKKANFQALKYFNKEIILNCNIYEDLIGMFTDMDYMKESKYLRQVIFGNMNPKRQVKMERYITEQILNYLLAKGFFKEKQIKMVSNDEMIFELDFAEAWDLWNEDYIKLINIIKDKLNFNVDIEVFKLNNINNTKYFVKKFINKTGYELMCVPLVYFAQVYKQYNNLQIEDNDLLFYYENQVCKFANPIEFEEDEN